MPSPLVEAGIEQQACLGLYRFHEAVIDILPGLKALGNNRAVAPMQVDVSQAAATLAVVLHLPTRPFFVSVSPPATNIFLVN